MTGFNEVNLGEALTFQRGFDITKKEQNEGKIPIISSSGISSFHNYSKVCGPGVIIGRKGTLGTVYYSKDDYWPHDTTLWIKDFKGNSPRFLSHFLKTLKLENFDTGSSNPTLNRNHIHKIKVVFPNTTLQRKIAAILSAYDDLIENNKRRIALLEKMAEEIYREWFVRMRFPGHEKVKFVKGVPEGWETKPSIEIFDVLSGGTPKTDIPVFWNGNIPFFTPRDASNDIYVLSTEKNITEKGLNSCNSRLYKKDTIFITARGTVGKLALAYRNMAMNQSCYALLPKKKGDIYFYFLSMKNAILYLKGVSKSGVFDNIIVDTFKIVPLLVPQEGLIHIFNKKVGTLIENIGILLETNVLLSNTRDKLLPRLISGKLSVENLDIQFPPSMKEDIAPDKTETTHA